MADFEKEDSERVLPSRHHSCNVEVHTKVLFVVQDQPERRGASGLLGGGSRLHPLFGMSCDFVSLELPFEACNKCNNQVVEYLEAKDWKNNPLDGKCQQCLGWSLNRLTSCSYVSSFEYPHFVGDETPGSALFHGPGRLPSSLLVDAWNHCIEMFAIRRDWLEADVKKYLQQLCINDATITSFIQKCRRHVYLQEVKWNAEEYTHEQIASTIKDSLESPKSYDLPLPPAMWLLADTKDKTEGIMHLSMGIQKAVFKFIICWATDNRNGSTLQRRLALNLAAVQDLKVAYCPCRPYKDEKFGGFTAEGYRAMTFISPFLYRSLLESNLEPLPRAAPNSKKQADWTRQDNINWMYLRGIEYSCNILAPEAKEQVRREMKKPIQPEVVNTYPEPISTDEIRDLVWCMYNMFRAIFCTNIDEVQAKHRATASVMRFLSRIEALDKKLNRKHVKPIWIAKFNFLGLLRVCESFVEFKHVRNLYEGGVIGEGIVKELRPLVAKGVHGRWATNLLLAHYRNCTLDHLISALEDEEGIQKQCPLGDNIESSKFKRYTTAAEVIHQMNKGRPIPVMVYGSETNWRAGIIIVTHNQWYFREIVFHDDGDYVKDPYGLTYHRVFLVHQEAEICLGSVNGVFQDHLGDKQLTFWDYALLFPDIIEDTTEFRYGFVRSGWQYLDSEYSWSEHD